MENTTVFITFNGQNNKPVGHHQIISMGARSDLINANWRFSTGSTTPINKDCSPVHWFVLINSAWNTSQCAILEQRLVEMGLKFCANGIVGSSVACTSWIAGSDYASYKATRATSWSFVRVGDLG